MTICHNQHLFISNQTLTHSYNREWPLTLSCRLSVNTDLSEYKSTILLLPLRKVRLKEGIHSDSLKSLLFFQSFLTSPLFYLFMGRPFSGKDQMGIWQHLHVAPPLSRTRWWRLLGGGCCRRPGCRCHWSSGRGTTCSGLTSHQHMTEQHQNGLPECPAQWRHTRGVRYSRFGFWWGLFLPPFLQYKREWTKKSCFTCSCPRMKTPPGLMERQGERFVPEPFWTPSW